VERLQTDGRATVARRDPYSLSVRTGMEVAVFLTRKSGAEVLILHRSAGQGGYWHVVAGGVEAGETATEAAERELREARRRRRGRTRSRRVRLPPDRGARGQTDPMRLVNRRSTSDVLSRGCAGSVGAEARLGARRSSLVRPWRGFQDPALARHGTGAPEAPNARRKLTASRPSRAVWPQRWPFTESRPDDS
jgi:8-oxo-dGTP pyrophosphatase MutT (NUDIX family)